MNTVGYYHAPVTNTTEHAERDFEGIIQEIRTSRALRESVAKIRAGQAKDERATLKGTLLPYITPHGTCAPARKNENFQRHSGLLLFDVDHVEDAEQLKARICEDPHTGFAFVSPSGDGVKFGTFTDADAATHEQHWTAAAAYFADALHVEIDPAPKALASACFLSSDPTAFYNPKAQKFNGGAPAKSATEDLPERLASLHPVDKGSYYKLDCPKCGRPDAFWYRGKSWLICSHKDTCGHKEIIPELAGSELHQSDDGNAQRFIMLHGDKLLYCNGKRKRWYCWDGTRFLEDRTQKVHYLARDVAKEMLFAEAAAIPSTEGMERKRKAAFAFAIASENRSRLQALVECAAVYPEIAVTPEMLDRDPMRICVRNGYLNLRTGKLEAPDREALVTRQAAVKFDPTATCPKWLGLIDKATCGRKDLAVFLQQLAGYLLTGETFEDKFFLFLGDGANGKSTILETIDAILGDYAVTPPPGTFLARRFDNPSGASPELALLQGARLATVSETDKGAKLATGLVKRLAAGGKGSARELFGGLDTTTPTVKIVIDSNYAPGITTNDNGIWRRVVRIPFDYTFKGDELIKDFRDKMKHDGYGEHSGILNWMLEGCRQWQEAGRPRQVTGSLELPKTVVDAIDEYKNTEDSVTRFLEERTTIGKDFSAAGGELYAAFKEWNEVNGEGDVMSNVEFAGALKGKGFDPIKTRKGRSWRGLGLNSRDF